MHIAINTSPLKTNHKFRGVGSYTQSLIDALQTYEKSHTYSFFTGNTIPVDADVVHYPYFDPFFLTLPFRKIKPTIVTVHDLIPLVYPDKFPPGIRGKMKWYVQKELLKQCDGIITDSYASAEDIYHIIGVPKSTISVVHLAPSPAFHAITDKTKLANVKTTYALDQQYVMYVGDINWNKNILNLIRAFASVRQIRRDVQLVLVGKAFVDQSLRECQQINNLIQECDLGNDIIKTGQVDNDTLATLYSMASLYVQPSYAEGFGFPVLEAMACGCPVVSSGEFSLKEIVGPGIMTGTTSDSIARGILKGLSVDRHVQHRLQSEWVKTFTWKSTANNTLLVYKKIYSKKR